MNTDIYSISVSIGERHIEIALKSGILATAETGLIKDGQQIPSSRITAIVGDSPNGFVAWVQILEADATNGGGLRLAHEGWVSETVSELGAVGRGAPASAVFSRVINPSREMCACQDDAKFGPLNCCTSSGGGCYVKCCGGCCADPVGCPGASCCP